MLCLRSTAGFGKLRSPDCFRLFDLGLDVSNPGFPYSTLHLSVFGNFLMYIAPSDSHIFVLCSSID